ncbi:TetR/AcrR family transcriptional regulator [Kribbella sp. CA-294648]|uniref:TetR/AcrR family transcriptional regulator n=1 Tax=Kribbella sp. CA-294648 TaxID=3239948 RepID=UPI003D930AA0
MASKTERTRERLLAVALELFVEQGYDGTSAGQIAARAGVTEMTFFRHFPTKASLLIGDPYDPVIGTAIRDQSSSLDPISRAAQGIRSAWQQLPTPASIEVRSRLRIVAQTPSLRAAMTSGTAATEAVITEALVDGGTAQREAAIAASAVMAALNTALLEWSLAEDEELGQAINTALDVLVNRHG